LLVHNVLKDCSDFMFMVKQSTGHSATQEIDPEDERTALL